MTQIATADGTVITVTVPLATLAEPDSADWWIEDETGATIQAKAAVSVGNLRPAGVVLSIPGNLNTLPTGKAEALRMIRVIYRAGAEFDGSKQAEFPVLIRPAQELVVQRNSFMTYNEAVSLMAGMFGLDGLKAAERIDRIAALSAAWRVLVRFRYIPASAFGDYDQSRLYDYPGRDGIGFLASYTEQQLSTLDARFLDALRRAQLVEANSLIEGGDQDGGQEAGLVSERIGEASRTWRQTKSVSSTLGISQATLRELRGWINLTPRIGRA